METKFNPQLSALKIALKNMFNDRFTFLKGSCLDEVPKFVKTNSNITLDIVHIDGAKATYKQDFFNIMPLLAKNAIVIFDDSNMLSVQQFTALMILLRTSVDGEFLLEQ